MDRRRFLTTAALASTAPLLTAQLWAQSGRARGFHNIRRGVGVFVGPGGTIGYLGTRDGAVIVDSQFPAMATTFLAGLHERSTGRMILINTHHHGDHTAGNLTLRPAVQQIVQHERCAKSHQLLLQNAEEAARTGLADVTFAERWSIDVGDERVTARYFAPAHTDGDAVVVFERANVVHFGDLVFNRVPPFVDRASGASIQSWISVLGRILRDYSGATFIFGHGKSDAVTGTAPDVALFRDFLTAAIDHVQRGLKEGRSQEEIVRVGQLRGFPEFSDAVKDYPSANPRFTIEHVLTAAYQEMTQ